MSDPGRKAFHTKIKETMTPDIFKSRGSKMAETSTDAADLAARDGQPDSSKSATQTAADKIGQAKHRLFHRGSGKKSTHDMRAFFTKRSEKVKA